MVQMSVSKPWKLEMQFNLRESELISERFGSGLFSIVRLLHLGAKATAP